MQSELLQQHLRDRDESCPRCGYNLRGASSNQCPECGEKLELCIAREKPLSRASNVIVLILSGASGLGLMYAGAWVWGWAIGKRTIFLRAEYDWHIWLPVIFFIACVPATVVTFLLRRQIDRLPVVIRWAMPILLAATALFCLYHNVRWWYDAGWSGPW